MMTCFSYEYSVYAWYTWYTCTSLVCFRFSLGYCSTPNNDWSLSYDHGLDNAS